MPKTLRWYFSYEEIFEWGSTQYQGKVSYGWAEDKVDFCPHEHAICDEALECAQKEADRRNKGLGD